MAGLISKRQQARNERALQDLVQNVEGNNVCADCDARNPCALCFTRVFFFFLLLQLHCHLSHDQGMLTQEFQL